MVILDTNVISELARESCDANVRAWLDRRSPSQLYLCAPVIGELIYGVSCLPPGRRRDALADRIDILENDLFAGRVLDFDRASATAFGKARAHRRALGRPLAPMDALIASVALANGMALATRNVDNFADIGLPLLNPFTDPA